MWGEKRVSSTLPQAKKTSGSRDRVRPVHYTCQLLSPLGWVSSARGMAPASTRRCSVNCSMQLTLASACSPHHGSRARKEAAEVKPMNPFRLLQRPVDYV